MTVQQAWASHRQWSAVATQAASALSRWRLVNLWLLVVGSVLGALAAQKSWFPAAATTALGVLCAALLALAGVVQLNFLNGDLLRRRLLARSVSEGLKGVVYQYLSGVAPFAGEDREARLATAVDDIGGRAGNQAGLVVGVVGDGADLPQVSGITEYVRERAVKQRDWHDRRTAEHRTLAGRWRGAVLAATAAGTVLAAIGGAVQGSDVSSWVAVATTVAAAFAAHLASQQHDRIAESYARTVLSLDALNRDFTPDSATPQEGADYVANVERILAAQTGSWVGIFSAA